MNVDVTDYVVGSFALVVGVMVGVILVLLLSRRGGWSFKWLLDIKKGTNSLEIHDDRNLEREDQEPPPDESGS